MCGFNDYFLLLANTFIGEILAAEMVVAEKGSPSGCLCHVSSVVISGHYPSVPSLSVIGGCCPLLSAVGLLLPTVGQAHSSSPHASSLPFSSPCVQLPKSYYIIRTLR